MPRTLRRWMSNLFPFVFLLASPSLQTALAAPVVVDNLSALGAWQPSGALSTAREGHTATLLPDGRVLAIGAGGNATADPAEASIEVYEPVGGSWTVMASMRPPRRGHTATLLPDGVVLIAGGDGGPDQPLVAGSALFDPATGGLAASSAMVTPRAFHTATLLPDGRVLAIGGGNPGFLDSVEVYHPATRSWAPLGRLLEARVYHTATLLPDGTVVVIGGAGAGGRLSSIERFDPATGRSTLLTPMRSPRGFHTATLLPDGRVLVAGGDNGSGDGFPAKAEILNPSDNSVVETAAMRRPRRHHTATLLPDGTVLMVGGDRNGPLAETELFDPKGPLIEWVPGPALKQERRLHSATLLHDGSVLAAGGHGPGGPLASAERLAPRPCDFTVDVPVAQALPDTTFAQLLALGGYQAANRKAMAVTTPDRFVAHSFVGLALPGMRIADATLTIVAEPGGSGSGNDAFHALVTRSTWASSPRISRAFGGPIGSIPGLGLNNGWTAAGAKTVATPLVGDVLAAMNTDGRLDVLVQDDSTVIRMYLRLHYICCDVWMTVPAPVSIVGPDLDAYLTSAQSFPPPSRKGFGVQTIDRAVGHSFTLPTLPGAIITSAKLTVSARPGGDGEVVFAEPQNDGLNALVAPAAPMQSWKIQPDLSPAWTSGGPAKSLTMTISDPALLSQMNDDERLDVLVQDDTTVYSMRLDLFYACCGDWRTLRRDGTATPHPDLVASLNAIGFQNGIKGFGSATTNSAFAHSFDSLKVPGMHISGIQLIVRGPGVGDINDTASVLVATVAGSQTDWPLTGNWDGINGQSLPLTLTHNGGNNSLFSALNTVGRLDVYVQDDTGVDALTLRLRYDCGPFRERLGPGAASPPWTLVARPDLWLEDTPHVVPASVVLDTGIEPDPQMFGQPMWQSRAIWVRSDGYDSGNPTKACANTTAQNPIFANGFENTVCIKIGNRGQATGSGVLHVYWAKAALGLGWDTKPGLQLGTTHGDWTELSTSVPIPPLGAGATTVVALPWAPPEPPFQQELHTCLLARIEALAPDHIWTELTDPNPASIPAVNHNTTMNNNIAWRNVQVVHDIITGGGRSSHPVVLRNLEATRQALAVQLRPLTEDGRPNFLEMGQVTWRMPQALYDAWKAAGAPGRGFRHIPGEAAVIVDAPEGALLTGLPLGPREAVEMQLWFAKRQIPLRQGAGTHAAETFDIEVIQVAEADGLQVEEGGVAYALRLPDAPPPATPTPSPTPSPGTLSNISTRGFVGTGDDVMIGGFILKDGSAKVVLRAIGSGLEASGVPGLLHDPRLRLFSGQMMIAENDNWEAGNCKAEAPQGLWPARSSDACLVITLQPGPYTAIVDGVGGTTGVALVEAFHSGGAGQLSNISTRGKVLTGDRVMIGGFIVRDRPVRAILRGLGKSLEASGVRGALQNPRIRLFSGQTVIAENEDWQSGNCKALAPRGLWPTDPREACLVVTLPPGPYTVIDDGVGGMTGVSLVEVFHAGR